MSRRQTRKCISLTAATYARLQSYCKATGVPMSKFVEQTIDGNMDQQAVPRVTREEAVAKQVRKPRRPSEMTLRRAERASRIIAAVAVAHCITIGSMLGPSRYKDVVHARQAAIYIVRTALGLSWPEIGRLFERDHSTCMDAFDRTVDDMQKHGPRRAIVIAAYGQLDSDSKEAHL